MYRHTTKRNCGVNFLKGMGVAGLGMLAAPVGGIFLYAAGAAYAMGNLAVANTVINVGPSPLQLRDYLNSLIKKNDGEYQYSKAKFLFFEKFKNYENRIISCVQNKYPCIVLLIRGTTNMHYINLIGLSMKKGKSDVVDKFAILDTNKTKYYLKRDDFNYWMKNTTASGLITMFKGGHIGNYNLIEIS